MFRFDSLMNNACKRCFKTTAWLETNKHVWTSDRIVKSPFNDITIPNVTVEEYLWRNMDKWATKIAVECAATSRRYTYEQVYKQSHVLAANLRKKFKLETGDTAAVMMPNLPEYMTTVFGILSAGGMVTTINPNYTSYEVQRQLIMSEAKLIFVVPETVAVVKEALKLCQKNIPKIMININETIPEGTVAFSELAENNNIDISILKDVKRSEDDVAMLLYSSGTTGLPKGVELTNRNVVANSDQQNTECRLHWHTSESHQDCSLLALPMFHSYGLNIITIHKFSLGIKLVTYPRFSPKTFVDVLSKYDFNLLYLAPPLILFLGSYQDILPNHFKQLRAIVSGAAPLPTADIERLLNKVNPNVDFKQGYGLTETCSLATISPVGYSDYTKVGFGLPNVELKVIDNDLNNLDQDEVGELVIKGPNVMKGYKDNIEANKEIFLDDKWLRTGDLAKIDKFGAVTIVERLKELIKVNAYQVAPAELENVCKEHPAVLDVAVVAVPDAVTGEKPKAFIVLRDNFKVSDEDIKHFVAERVAPYKRIKEVDFIDRIPKNPSGKILRRIIKEKYC